MESASIKGDIRDYQLFDKIHSLYDKMTIEELKVAHEVISIISEHLDKKHFQEQKEIDVKALVKTFGELDEIGITILINEKNKGK